MRRNRDAYYSPNIVSKWLLDNARVDISGKVLEAANGEGAISKPLQMHGLDVITNDINKELQCDYHLDITHPETYDLLPAVDWIITNPPFLGIDISLPLMYKKANTGVAIYLRKTVTEPTKKRQDWLQAHQANLAEIIFCPRISFTGTGTDSCSCDWFIWTKDKPSGTICTWVTK